MAPKKPVELGPAIEDGRVRRGARNREAIVQALFELIGAGELQPTAEQVAERAGVRVRTVFRHFSDMASLNAELSARVRREVRPLLTDVQPGGDLATRVRALVRARCAAFERMAPYKRSGDSLRWRVRHLQRDHEEVVRELRAQLQQVLPELADVPSELAAALELVTSFEAWNRLRTDQRLGPDRARTVIEQAALAVLSRA